MQTAIEKAGVLVEALPYIQRFRGETIVVKFGGSVMENESAYRAILEDVAFMECVGMRPVLVHGGGKAISRRMRKENIHPDFVRGLRVTDEVGIKVVQEVLNEEVNPEIVRVLNGYGGRARTIRGDDIISVEKHTEKTESGELLEWGYVGNVTDVDPNPVRECIENDVVPVITPLGHGPEGVYNVNADEAAAALAAALQARKLVFLTDVPGLMMHPGDSDSLISTLRVESVSGLTERGIIAGGMRPKVKGAVTAIDAGIRKTHIIDAGMPHSILLEIFTDRGIGTEIVR